MVLIAARTGMNACSTYALGRDCLTPHELDDNLFYCSWEKPRAGRRQRQLHRIDRRNGTGVVALIQFMRLYTEPLASRAGPAERTKLFLHFSSQWGQIVSPRTTSCDSFVITFREFVARHGLPHFTLVNMRPSAATQLYRETGGNLRKVQQFLQHARLAAEGLLSGKNLGVDGTTLEANAALRSILCGATTGPATTSMWRR